MNHNTTAHTPSETVPRPAARSGSIPKSKSAVGPMEYPPPPTSAVAIALTFQALLGPLEQTMAAGIAIRLVFDVTAKAGVEDAAELVHYLSQLAPRIAGPLRASLETRQRVQDAGLKGRAPSPQPMEF